MQVAYSTSKETKSIMTGGGGRSQHFQWKRPQCLTAATFNSNSNCGRISKPQISLTNFNDSKFQPIFKSQAWQAKSDGTSHKACRFDAILLILSFLAERWPMYVLSYYISDFTIKNIFYHIMFHYFSLNRCTHLNRTNFFFIQLIGSLVVSKASPNWTVWLTILAYNIALSWGLGFI